MMRRATIAFSIVTFGISHAISSARAAASDHCNLERYAELPITMAGTRPLVAGSLNGANALFLIDTGAPHSTLARDAVEKFHLKLGKSIMISGTSGITEARIATARDFSLTGMSGGKIFHDVEFAATGNSELYGRGADGLIGQNVFGHGDMEFDLANGVVRLFVEKDCGSKSLAYWHENASVAVVEIKNPANTGHHLVGNATLNGAKIQVIFDSGAARSVLTLQAAARAGITPEQDDVKAAGFSKGIGTRARENSIARFHTLDLGGEKIENARLLIGDIPIREVGDMLLGADFFLSHRIFVSLKQRRIYFTYNGGRVFDLGEKNRMASDASSEGTSPGETSRSESSTGGGLNAAELMRRAQASAARLEFVKAIAEFDAAIKLDESDSEKFYQRGSAKWQLKQEQSALEDFNRALTIKPDHASALLARGTMRLTMKNDGEAASDFAAALNASPDDRAFALKVARIYSQNRRFDEALLWIDRWMEKYPKDDRMADALMGRCYVRTLSGRDLDLALNDCNLAIKKGLRVSEMFDYRGQLYLRRGDTTKAAADFKTALKLQPKNATALYGLGLAQRNQGSTAEGEKNIQSAVAIMPKVAAYYAGFQLAPTP